MDAPRWLVDEMLGRLARYLRFLGQDTAYAKGRSDEEIRDWALREGRILVTRDRLLARRTAGSILIRSVVLADQLRAVRDAFPSLELQVQFVRCTLCNGRLEPAEPTAPEEQSGLPKPAEPAARGPVYICRECHHSYWEGSHTSRIRRTIAEVLGTP
ncbi:MAG TPA: Mut7-C RNAse domain-containing protein [Thermoplasmata archaeon]|nr:Mut7-C RNAse domain-containing protein [Thermoplasmata archaeon]